MTEANTPKLLLVEDDAKITTQVTRALTLHFEGCCTCLCTQPHKLSASDLMDVDLVISDIRPGYICGLELLNILLEKCPDLPVVFLVGEDDLERAIRALQGGAYDYIVKAGAYLQTVPLIVEKNIETWRMRQENLRLSAQLHQTLRMVQRKNDQLEEAVTKLQTAAGTDPLTGLANRRSFGQAFERSFAECCRQDRDLACMMIDIDGFKALNDTLGHPCGDELLQRVARVLEANCRRSDVAGRFGGDEFILLLPDTDVDFATKVADRIRQEFDLSVQAMFKRIEAKLNLSLSQGVTTLQVARPANPQQMVAYADHALYRAKQAGKARLVVYEPAGGTDRTRSQYDSAGL